MKLSFCLVVFALSVAVEFGLIGAAPSPSADSQMPLKRVARQTPQPPQPPGMPDTPEMPGMPKMPGTFAASDMFESIPGIPGAATRNKREAKGGGAMPTRKG